jgi:hypothetical protein
MMHESEKSDPFKVARKPANNPEGAAAEPVERREGAKGNTSKYGTRWALSFGNERFLDDDTLAAAPRR